MKLKINFENQILALFEGYFWPFNSSHVKIKSIFVISATIPSTWNVFIKFRWHDEKLTIETIQMINDTGHELLFQFNDTYNYKWFFISHFFQVWVWDMRNMGFVQQKRESSLKYQTRCLSCFPNKQGKKGTPWKFVKICFKGQLISEWTFGVFKSPQKPTKFMTDFWPSCLFGRFENSKISFWD